MTDYSELKQLAEAAKNWGGEVGEGRWYTAECFKQPYFSIPDAEFLAACEPGFIRALIAENERLQGCEDVLRNLASYCGCGGYNAPEVDPEVFAKKIMDGINIFNPLAKLADQRGAECDQLKAENEALRRDVAPLDPVGGDRLPQVGSKVFIHLSREDAWVEHTVAGYYVWRSLGEDLNLHRVFVRVRDADGYLNARLLKDVRTPAAMAKGVRP